MLHLQNAGDGAQRARDLGVDLVSARQPDLDFLRRNLASQDDRDFTFAPARELAFNPIQWTIVAHDEPQPPLRPRRRARQRLDRDDPRAHVLALQRRRKRDQNCGALLQHVAKLVEAFLKNNCLILASHVRQKHDSHLRTGLGPPFRAVEDDCREPARRRPPLDVLDEARPARDPELGQEAGVSVERVPGKKETGRVIFALQGFRCGPGRDFRQDQIVGLRLAEKRVLPGFSVFGMAVCGGENGLDRGENRRAVWRQLVEGAASREIFEDFLVHFARIEPPREIGKARKGLLAARAHDRLGLPLPNSLHG